MTTEVIVVVADGRHIDGRLNGVRHVEGGIFFANRTHIVGFIECAQFVGQGCDGV